ncbi:capsular polysaccharide biosynthesis protein [Mucilaginibacter gynuensis]|uniref:protein-tyrosine-phosphatase n=1 Tax=Mucilaginibacter gynuensis TaxID=1302236 RepID=A0ABP8HAE9_9SPHI
MFDFFRKPKVAAFNYETVAVDMHSHVLPGIDDGAPTPEDSIILIRKMMSLGISKIIATPHIMADYYRNTPETINNALQLLKAALVKEQINIPISAAAEHYFDENFEQAINEGRAMTMGDKYVLFELSFLSMPGNILEMIRRMREVGYRPILAHPERYLYMSVDQLKRIHDEGCDLQLNTISLTGYFGKASKKIAEELIDRQMVDFISSDMHHPRHATAFEEALRMPYLEKVLFDYPLKNKLLL